MPGKQHPADVLKYRYGNDFSRFGGQMPEIMYDGFGQSGKNTARGLEQRYFEHLGGLEGTANKQNPVGVHNTKRETYLKATDKHLEGRKSVPKKRGRC